MKQAQPWGQKIDQARARFRRAVESGEKAMQALQKAQENCEQAQQEGIQAQTDLLSRFDSTSRRQKGLRCARPSSVLQCKSLRQVWIRIKEAR